MSFGRIFLGAYPNPLGYGKTPSRFSDPRRIVARRRYGVVYLGESLKVCFLEAVLRDQRDGVVGFLPIGENELERRCYATIETTSALRVVNLRGERALRMGVPTDVSRSSSHALGRKWSLAFYQHPSEPDGIVYPSRLNGQTDLAVYDRAVNKLRRTRVVDLVDAPGLAAVLDDLMIDVVPSD
jgi:hypothetical protein